MFALHRPFKAQTALEHILLIKASIDRQVKLKANVHTAMGAMLMTNPFGLAGKVEVRAANEGYGSPSRVDEAAYPHLQFGLLA